MNELSFERVARTIYEAPLGKYMGRDGSEVLAQYAGAELELHDREPLYRKGEPGKAFYIVTRGRLAMVREGTDHRKELILHVLEEGDMTGELTFVDGTQHTVTCIALGDASVLTFEVKDVNYLIENHPYVVYNFMRAVIVRVHQTNAAISRQQQELAEYISTGGRRQ